MKRILFIILLCTFVNIFSMAQRVEISTNEISLMLRVGDNGRLYQVYLGERINKSDVDAFPWRVGTGSDDSVSERGWEVYAGNGTEDYFEPALAITHPDGNLTTILKYVTHHVEKTFYGTKTEITLRDDVYPVTVKLFYEAYSKENIIKTWSEIQNKGKQTIELWRYASTILYFDHSTYYLTEFASDWAKEAQMYSQQLQYGKKVIDTKLGSRAAMFSNPFFEIGMDTPAQENAGEVLMGTIGWTGNFRFTFEIDNTGVLRVIPSINPYASTYELKGNESFVTPEFIFTLSQEGLGKGSRSFHDWARNYQLKDGNGNRMTLLNNWENTYFDFDQDLLANLMKEAKELGVDLFLLDDGWFGNKYPRNNDKVGLGDWEVNKEKLPGGIKALTEAAKNAGVKFGIWIEPEMVNPKSELFEKHPDWAYSIPNREPYYYRNQLVLDLNNPQVQDYVFGVVDKILTENPDVEYFKWDCNSPITNIYSHYLKDKQQQLYIGHVRGVYNVLKRVKDKYPNIPMMMCSGGGSRCDFESLKYFTEYWCSDNTEPVERIFIQWGFSQFMPVKAMAAHVTEWNKDASIKFRTDVASMCKLGFDIGLKDLTSSELKYIQVAIKNFNRLKPVILDGDQYRLVSPYEGQHAAIFYVDNTKNHAVLFAYDMYPRYAEKITKVKLQGLDANKQYVVTEINREQKEGRSILDENGSFVNEGKVYSGEYLMKVGLDVFSSKHLQSRVIEIAVLEYE